MKPSRGSSRVVGVIALLVAGLVSACSGSGSSSTGGGTAAQSGSGQTSSTSGHPLAGTTIKVGVAVGPPFMFQDAQGNWTSFSAALIRKFGAWEGAKIELVPSSFQTFIAGLQAGKYDMIQPINQTPQRAAVANFSSAVSGGGTTFFVKAGSSFTSLSDLNRSSVTIAAISGSADEAVARKLLPKANIRSLPTATVADLADEVVAGRSDAMVDSTYLAPAVQPKFNLKSIPDYATNPNGLSPVNIAFPVAQDKSTLLSELNKFIAIEKSSGDLKRLTTQWLTLENDLKG